MDLGIEGKVALVTGSSKGIGAAIVRTLSREGAAVVVHGRSREDVERIAQAITEQGGKVGAAVGDLGSDIGALEVAEAALGVFGAIDILVNNAGYALEDSRDAPSAADWVDAYNVNVVGAVRLISRLLPQMKERRWGRFIQIASIAAFSPQANYGAYGASKAAIVNLSASLAKGLAGTGITSNVVSPGVILSGEIREWVTQTATEQKWPGDWPDFERRFTADFMPNLVGRMGRAEEIADLVAFLSSPKADYINCAHYRIDGGSRAD